MQNIRSKDQIDRLDPHAPVFVVGAGGAVGFEIARLLCERHIRVIATMRTYKSEKADSLAALGAEIKTLDLDDRESCRQLRGAAGAIMAPILTTSAQAADALLDVKRLVFFSSNNVAIDPDAPVYARLLKAEGDIKKCLPHAKILRPTMIYGYAGDGNLSNLIRALRRWPITPIPGRGDALQEPAFYKDVAAAAVDVFLETQSSAAIHAVSGPETVSQRALYSACAEAAGVSLRTVPIPIKAAGRAVHMIEKVGIRLPISSAQLQRASIDKCAAGPERLTGTTSLRQGLNALVQDLDGARARP